MLIIVFDDNSFIEFEGGQEYESSVIREAYQANSEWAYVTLGLMTEEERLELAKERSKKCEEQRLKWDREQYEKLKAKFEGIKGENI